MSKPPFLPRRARWLLAAALAAACGPAAVPRYSVAGRQPAWRPGPDASGSGHAPLSRSWEFEAQASSWRPDGPGQGRRSAGRWRLTGRPFTDLVGPAPGQLDPELHHWLSVRVATAAPATLTVHWRGPDQRFDPGRRTSAMALEADGELHTYLLSIASFRGIREASDAEEGLEQVRLRFSDPDGGEVHVELDQVAALSDHDDARQQGFVTGRLSRGGVYREGLALRLPGSVRTSLDARPGDHLRLALALAGARGPVDVSLWAGPERGTARSVTLRPGQPWAEQDLDLSSAAGQAGPVEVSIECATPDEPGAVLLVGSVLHLRPETEHRPDVLLYVEDTLRADRLGLLGYGQDTDPHLRRIAAAGASFDRVFSTSSWTRPAIASMHTSLLPLQHGMRRHTERIPQDLITLAEVLADEGYVTLSLVTNYHAGSWAGLDQGFDVHSEPRAHGAHRVTSTLTSSVLREPIAAALERWADTRLFLFVHSLDPHAPYEPEPKDLAHFLAGAAARSVPEVGDRARYERDSLHYDAEVRHNDGELARLDLALERHGLRDDTLLVFVSDHGEAFAEHGAWQHRRSLYQEEVAVPWVLRLPGVVPPGLRLDQPASLIDLAPTLAGLLGVTPPASWGGRDLSSLCRDEEPPAGAGRRPLFLDVVYELPQRGAGQELAVVWSDHKLVARVRDGSVLPTELYDLIEDPGETRNLLGQEQQAQAAANLAQRLQQVLDAGPVLPAAERQAEDMDPALREWMQAMGYLR